MDLYVAERNNHRVHVLGSDGRWGNRRIEHFAPSGDL
jgi:hypothetical protein